MDLTKVEDIKRRWQEYTLYIIDLHDPDDHDGVITNLEPLEPEIQECEVNTGLRKHHYEQS